MDSQQPFNNRYALSARRMWHLSPELSKQVAAIGMIQTGATEQSGISLATGMDFPYSVTGFEKVIDLATDLKGIHERKSKIESGDVTPRQRRSRYYL